MPRDRDVADQDDLVTFLVKRIREVVPGLTDRDVFQMQRDARARWGGMRPYVRVHAPQDARQSAPRNATRAGDVDLA